MKEIFNKETGKTEYWVEIAPSIFGARCKVFNTQKEAERFIENQQVLAENDSFNDMARDFCGGDEEMARLM